MALQEGVNAEINRLVQLGSGSKSIFQAMLKSDNKIRVCGNYSRTVNPQIHVTQHPFPGIEEVMANVVGEEFITLDVRSAFHHMLVDDTLFWILTLNTPIGLYRPTVLEFGYASAPAEWQQFMDGVFKGKPVAKVHEDIFILGKNCAKLLQHLRHVLQTYRENGIQLNLQKCKFFQQHVKFLGYIVDKNSLSKTTK